MKNLKNIILQYTMHIRMRIRVQHKIFVDIRLKYFGVLLAKESDTLCLWLQV